MYRSRGISSGGAVSLQAAVVIVGSGQSGGRAAEALRQGGHTGRITLIGDELHPPYERPALSKEFLSSAAAEQPRLGAASWLVFASRHNDAAWQDGRRIDQAHDAVELDEGAPVELPSPDSDDRALARQLVPGGRGPSAGELSADHRGQPAPAAAPVFRRAYRGDRRWFHRSWKWPRRRVRADVRSRCWSRGLPMARGFPAPLGAFYAELSPRKGVDLRVRTAVRRITDETRPCARSHRRVATRSWRTRWSSASVSIPNVELAQTAGLEIDNGLSSMSMAVPEFTDLRRGRRHQPFQPTVRPPRAPRILAERAEPGDRRRAQHPWCCGPVRRGAVALERSVRAQPADRGHSASRR